MSERGAWETWPWPLSTSVQPEVLVARTGAVDVPLPQYQTEGAAGMDLHAALAGPLTLAPGCRAKIPTGIRMAIPYGYEGQIRGRSGLAFAGLVAAHVGTIDADYRGELAVLLFNLDDKPHVIGPLERIAQVVIAPVARARVTVVNVLDDTPRGDRGFGSTGR